MLVQKLNFPPVLPDNEETYFRYIEAIVGSHDMDAAILFSRKGEGMLVRISPSSMGVFGPILDQIKRFHTMISIQVDFSKSMKAGNNITYSINF